MDASTQWVVSTVHVRMDTRLAKMESCVTISTSATQEHTNAAVRMHVQTRQEVINAPALAGKYTKYSLLFFKKKFLVRLSCSRTVTE